MQSPVDAPRRVPDWGVVGTVVAAVSILAAVGSWIKAARRPAVFHESAVSSRRYHVIRLQNPARQSECASWSARIPKPPPVSYNGGRGREVGPDDVNPTKSFSTSCERADAPDYESNESHVIDEAAISSSATWTADPDGARRSRR